MAYRQVNIYHDSCIILMKTMGIDTFKNTIMWLSAKSVQEKRTEVLENKVDRMWVSNAFFEWTLVKSSTSEGRRQCRSSFLRNLTFSVICDKMFEHYTLQQAHITVLLIMQLTMKTQDLTRCDPHEYYQVNCCSVSHKTACYA